MTKLVVLLNLCSILSLISMHPTTPAIVDTNAGQSLAQIVPAGQKTIIGIFGATPRLSLCQQFTTALATHLAQLSEHEKKSKRLKGVSKGIKSCLTQLHDHPGLASATSLLESSAMDDLADLFMHAGIDPQIHSDNIRTVLKTSRNALNELLGQTKGFDHTCLVHVLLPSYFADIKLRDNLETDIIDFLSAVARYYQKLYQQLTTKNDPRVLIVIPRIDAFTDMAYHPTQDKLITNLSCLQATIMQSHRQQSGFLLLDQNGPELARMVEVLHTRGFTQTAGRTIPIKNKCGAPSTKFHPYLLKPDKDYPFTSSPLVNQQLVNYLQSNTGRKDVDEDENI